MVMRRKSVRAVCAVGVAAVVAVTAPGGGAAVAAGPSATVAVGAVGKVGRFDTAVVTVAAGCQVGAVVQELVVAVTQGDLTGSRGGSFALRCDGAQHRVQVEVTSGTGNPYVAGSATVTARLTVLDEVTMDPLPQAVDVAVVVLRPAAELTIGWAVRLNAGGSASVPVRFRCQRPWVEAGLGVGVSQAQGTRYGFTFAQGDLVCDGRWHDRRMRVVASGSPYVVGPVTVSADLTVYAPVDFDPVDQARVTVDRVLRRW